MHPHHPVRTINVRIPEELYLAVKEIAEQRRQSFNRFTEEALSRAAREERCLKVRRAFEQLAEEKADIEFYLPAEAEVVLGEPE